MPKIPTALKREFDHALANDRKVDAHEADKLIEVAEEANSSGCIGRVCARGDKGLKKLLTTEPDSFSREAADKIARHLKIEPPSREKTWDLRADHKVWTTTYWPYADFTGTGKGDPKSNLWADGGAMEKFDSLLAARSKKTGAKAHERTPALGFLAPSGGPSGYFIPSPNIKEADAERTTGIDFDGNGALDPDVKVDFLDEFGRFGKDGKTTGTMNVGWWGSCDKVAVAGILFDEPKKPVTLDGVTFTPQDIKGLLTVIANSQAGGTDFVGNRYDGRPDEIRLKSGETVRGTIENIEMTDLLRGTFRRREGDIVEHDGAPRDLKLTLADGSRREIAAADVATISRESMWDPDPLLFHKTVKAWLGEKRAFAMDHDRGDHVWNDSYDHAIIEKTSKRPSGFDTRDLVGEEGPYSGGTLSFYETKLMKGDQVSKRYKYWIETKDGKDMNSGWLPGNGFDQNPDFLWRPTVKDPAFTGRNSRNPFVLPEIVREIYEKSIAA